MNFLSQQKILKVRFFNQLSRNARKRTKQPVGFVKILYQHTLNLITSPTEHFLVVGDIVFNS